jgi:hypothetical protein
VRLECHESENLYLTDEVLAIFQHTWATASSAIGELEKIVPAEKAAALALIRTDRRYGNLKGLMELLSHKLDFKNVPWTIRVSSVIGKVRPSGTLAEYLGASLLAALWPPVALPAGEP